jgi:hypothetical protein
LKQVRDYALLRALDAKLDWLRSGTSGIAVRQGVEDGLYCLADEYVAIYHPSRSWT